MVFTVVGVNRRQRHDGRTVIRAIHFSSAEGRTEGMRRVWLMMSREDVFCVVGEVGDVSISFQLCRLRAGAWHGASSATKTKTSMWQILQPIDEMRSIGCCCMRVRRKPRQDIIAESGSSIIYQPTNITTMMFMLLTDQNCSYHSRILVPMYHSQ